MGRIENLLPVVIMAESFMAAAVLLCCRRWGSGLYWLAAGVLNMAVIFFIKRWG